MGRGWTENDPAFDSALFTHHEDKDKIRWTSELKDKVVARLSKLTNDAIDTCFDALPRDLVDWHDRCVSDSPLDWDTEYNAVKLEDKKARLKRNIALVPEAVSRL